MRASPAKISTLLRNGARNGYIGGQLRLSSSLVTTEKDSSSGIAVVSLNRPPANAFNLPFMKEIIATVKDCEADSSVQGIVMATAHKSIFREGLEKLGVFCEEILGASYSRASDIFIFNCLLDSICILDILPYFSIPSTYQPWADKNLAKSTQIKLNQTQEHGHMGHLVH